MKLVSNVAEVEAAIKELEGFVVIIRMNVGNLVLPYAYTEKAPEEMTLLEFIDQRITPLFIKEYPGAEISFVNGFYQFSPGRMTVGQLRATYLR